MSEPDERPTLQVIARFPTALRAAMTAMLLALAVFLGAMALLASHDSELSCDREARCLHWERYPFGFTRTEPVASIVSAGTALDPGGRVVALKLLLRHPDGSKTEYQGVGKNGDRAEETARQINAFVAQPVDGRVFALRSGSIPVAIFLCLVALGGLLMVPHFFARTRVALAGNMLTVVIGRWPAPARLIELPRESIGFGARQVTRAGDTFFAVCAVRTDRDAAVELGVQSRSESVASAKAEVLNAWLSSWADG